MRRAAQLTLRTWQAKAYPRILKAQEQRRHGVVWACTGSGKSLLLALVAARGIPLTHRCQRIVISAPTQALVSQVHGWFRSFGIRTSRFYSRIKETECRIIVACNNSLSTLTHRLRRRRLWVEAWIADECHRTEAPGMQAWAKEWPTAWRLGFTATPHRASLTERLSLYQDLLYDYTAEDALHDGVIVMPRILPHQGEEGSIDEVCLKMLQQPALKGLPGLVSAWDIEDATRFAEMLGAHGICAAAIHGKQDPTHQRMLRQRLQQGRLHCLVHVNLLTEGADLPWLRWLCLRRAVKSRNRFIQEVGRVLRCAPGKDAALILDPSDLFNKLSLTYEALLGMEGSENIGETEDISSKRMEASSGILKGKEVETSGHDGLSRLEDQPWLKLIPKALRLKQPLRSLAMQATLRHPSARMRVPFREAKPQPLLVGTLRQALLGAEAQQHTIPKGLYNLIAFYAKQGIQEQLHAGDMADLISLLRAVAQGWNPQWLTDAQTEQNQV